MNKAEFRHIVNACPVVAPCFELKKRIPWMVDVGIVAGDKFLYHRNGAMIPMRTGLPSLAKVVSWFKFIEYVELTGEVKNRYLGI